MKHVPDDYEVRPLTTATMAAATLPTTCGTCGRTWDDAVITSITPAPSGRCPFEYFHPDPDREAPVADSVPAAGQRSYVLVVRHPDDANLIITEGDVRVVDIDLGSSFDGEPGDDETAAEWVTNLDGWLADVPVTSVVFREAVSTVEQAVERFPEACAWVDAYVARRTAQAAGQPGRPPAKPLIVTKRHVKCPHCGARDALTEVDVSHRHNQAIEIEVTGGRITGLSWSRGDGNYHTDSYQCTECQNPVTVDGDNISEEWS